MPKEQLQVFIVLILKVQIFNKLKRKTDIRICEFVFVLLDQIWILFLLIQIKEEENVSWISEPTEAGTEEASLSPGSGSSKPKPDSYPHLGQTNLIKSCQIFVLLHDDVRMTKIFNHLSSLISKKKSLFGFYSRSFQLISFTRPITIWLIIISFIILFLCLSVFLCPNSDFINIRHHNCESSEEESHLNSLNELLVHDRIHQDQIRKDQLLIDWSSLLVFHWFCHKVSRVFINI